MDKQDNNLKRRPYLRSKFEDGDRPDGQDFTDLIDSSLNQKSDKIYAKDHKIGIGTENPSAPLEIVGKEEEVCQSLVSSDGENSTFRIGHPIEAVVAIGCNQAESLQLGAFKKNGASFENYLHIEPKGNVGISVAEATEKLHVGGSVKIDKNLFIGDGKLSFKKGKLYLKTCDATYQLTMTEVSILPDKPLRKILTIVLIVLLVLVIILLLVLLYNGYTGSTTSS